MKLSFALLLASLLAGCGWNIERVPYQRFDADRYCHDPQSGVVRIRDRSSIAWRQHFAPGRPSNERWNRHRDPARRDAVRSQHRDLALRVAPSYLYHQPYSVWAHQLDPATLAALPVCGQAAGPS